MVKSVKRITNAYNPCDLQTSNLRWHLQPRCENWPRNFLWITSSRLRTIHRNSSGHSSCNQANAPRWNCAAHNGVAFFVHDLNWISLVASWKSVRVSKKFCPKEIQEAEAGKSRKKIGSKLGKVRTLGSMIDNYLGTKKQLSYAVRIFCLQKPSNSIHSEYPTISIFRPLSCWGWSNHTLQYFLYSSHILIHSNNAQTTTLCRSCVCNLPDLCTIQVFCCKAWLRT